MSASAVDAGLREAVGNHLRRHLGPIEGVVGEHEKTHVPIDLFVVAPSARRPFRVVVTCGMSRLRMHPPEEFASCQRAELFLGLPSDWRLDGEALRDPRWFWPFGLLKRLARHPHTGGGWLWERHIVGADGAVPHGPGTAMNGALIAPAINMPPAFDALRSPELGEIRFLSVLPLHPAETQLGRDDGVTALYGAFADADVDVVVRPGRPSSVV